MLVRDEASLRTYFDQYLRVCRAGGSQAVGQKALQRMEEQVRSTPPHTPVSSRFNPKEIFKKRTAPRDGSDPLSTPLSIAEQIPTTVHVGDDQTSETYEDTDPESVVDEVILVRKLGALASLRARRHAVLKQLEVVCRSHRIPLIAK